MLIAAALIGSAAYSQTFELAAKGSYRSTWLFNDSLSKLGSEQDYDKGWGYNYGLGATFYFNKNLGIEVNGLLGMFEGNYAGSYDSIKYNSGVSLTTLDIPLLLKLRTKSGGAYLELGPQYTILSKAVYSYKGTDTTYTRDVSSLYAGENIAVMLGFGVNIDLTKRLLLNTGIRFEYGLSDLIGVDAQGVHFRNPFAYKGVAKTWSAAGGLNIGLAWRFGKIEEDESGSSSPAPAGM